MGFWSKRSFNLNRQTVIIRFDLIRTGLSMKFIELCVRVSFSLSLMIFLFCTYEPELNHLNLPPSSPPQTKR